MFNPRMVEEGQHMDDNLYEAARQGRNIPGDINDQQLRSRTPGDCNNVLHVAAQYGNQQFITLVVARLGEHRCQLLCQQNSQGETPLHLAAQFGNLETVCVLLTAHDDAQLNTVAPFANQKKLCWNKRDKQGNTPLHKALQFGHEDIALSLLDMDFQVISIDNNLGESVAYLAAENFCKRFLLRILNEDRFSQLVSLSGPSGQTVFHSARRLEEDIMESLINIRGGTPLLKSQDNKKGRTVVHYAAKENRVSMVKKLLTADSSLAYMQDYKGSTPLHRASKKGLFRMVQTILELSPQSVEIRDNNGKTALHVAKINNIFMPNCLGRTGMKVLINQVDNDGNTPLHIAMINRRHNDAFALMSIHGCNWRLKNNEGFNAMQTKGSRETTKLSPVYNVLWYLQYRQPGRCKRKLVQIIGAFITCIASSCTVNLRKAEEKDLENLQNKIAIAAVLLIPILFAATFSVPGGYDQVTGKPILRNQSSFKLYMFAVAVASLMAVATLITCTFGVGKRILKKYMAQVNILFLQISLAWAILAYVSGYYAINEKVSKREISYMTGVGVLYLVYVFNLTKKMAAH